MVTYMKGHACKGPHAFKTTGSQKTKICRKCGSVRPGPHGKWFGGKKTKAVKRRLKK